MKPVLSSLQLWQQKLLQAFHDPPNKPFRIRGHQRVAAALFHTYTQQQYPRFGNPRPDWAAAGADRPVVDAGRGRGRQPQVDYLKAGNALATHPLAPGRLRLTHLDGKTPQEEADFEADLTVLADETRELPALDARDWQDEAALRGAFFAHWRRLRDELVVPDAARPENVDLLWELLPADTRCPDVTIWDHLRVASALAFVNRVTVPEEQPWLLAFSVGPVQSFIEEGRKGQDLWVGSMLVAEMAWAAIAHFVETYGPDCILTPDLRGNPRADLWLHRHYLDALPGHCREPGTFAAVVPNSFYAVLPRGGGGGLPRLEELADGAAKRVQERWASFAERTLDWLLEQIDPHHRDAVTKIWHRQHQQVFHTTWSAVPWQRVDPRSERIRDFFTTAPALPAATGGGRPLPSPSDQAARERRFTRLGPWIPASVWAHYDLARDTFGRMNSRFIHEERGFDYALTSYQLKVRHQMRKLSRLPAAIREPGEKCTLCHRREALCGHFEEDPTQAVGVPIQARRASVREFWSNEKLDPEGKGAERLCGVCALKRFVVAASLGKPPASIAPDSLLDVALGPIAAATRAGFVDKDKARLPFPSTAMLATQEYLEQLIAAAASLRGEIGEYVRAYDSTRLPRTAFPMALPRLAALAKRHEGDPLLTGLLQIEPRYLFPETIDVEIRAARTARKAPLQQALGRLKTASRALRRAADQRLKATPSPRIAVLVLDGDRMGDLLLGLPERIAARWGDVLHPEAKAWLETAPPAVAAGWPGLLAQKRLNGPTLQAFISRALAELAHRIVPWVVEQEFGGRLVYTGGDDVLALAPAGDALGIAVRLQQLFAAGWIADSRHLQDPWAWRKGGEGDGFDPRTARQRFRVLDCGDGTPIDLAQAPVLPHMAAPETGRSVEDLTGRRIYPGLGAGQSLSGAILFAHYKAPLGGLLKQARELAKRAKKDERRGRLGVAHRSRGAAKSETILRWEDQPLATITAIRDAFRDGRLPKKLPYKLRSYYADARAGVALLAAAVKEAAEGSDSEVLRKKREEIERLQRLRPGLLEQAVEGVAGEDRAAVLRLWENDLAAAVTGEGSPLPPADRSVSGLILCRYLAGAERAAEEEDE